MTAFGPSNVKRVFAHESGGRQVSATSRTFQNVLPFIRYLLKLLYYDYKQLTEGLNPEN